MPTLTLYYFLSCPYCRKVLKFIEKNSVENIELKNTDEPDNKSELIAVGGKFQVPCLFIDGVPLYESKDIIDYLANNQ